MIEKKEQVEFLYKAIEDTQGLIRFVDAKVSVAIIIISALWSILYSEIPDYIQIYTIQKLYLVNPILMLLDLAIVSYYMLKSIAPMRYPRENLDLREMNQNKLDLINKNLFFIPKIKQRKLSQNLTKYIEEINKLDHNDIITILSFEFHKLSYLRNLKFNRFRQLIRWSWIMVIHFLIFMAMHLLAKKLVLDNSV